MGGSPSKAQVTGGADARTQCQTLLLELADKTDHLAETKCVKYVESLYEKSQELRDAAQQWDKWQKDAEALAGPQVFKTAAALQVLHAKLLWCHGRLDRIAAKPPLLHPAERQAAKALHALRVALEAHTNFHTCLLVALQESKAATRPGAAHRHSSRSSHGPPMSKRSSLALSEALQLHLEGMPSEQAELIGVGHLGAAAAEQLIPLDAGPPGAGAAAQQWREHVMRPARGSDAGGAAAAGGGAAGPQPSASQQLPAWQGDQADLDLLTQQVAQGDVQALLLCAHVLREGTRAIAPDPPATRSMLLQAAYADVVEAVLALGAMAEGGEGLAAPDPQEAAAWYCRAAQLGSAEGAYAWAFALEHGQGVQADAGLAGTWYETAAAAGHAGAMNNLGRMLFDGLLQLPSSCCSSPDPAAGGAPAGVDSAAETAVDWFRRASEAGSAAAWFNLGTCWLAGRGVPGGAPDEANAADCFDKAAAAGHVGAHLKLAEAQVGQGRFSAAVGHLQAAADTGSAEALLKLAQLAERDACLVQQAAAAGGGGSSAADEAQAAAEEQYHRAADAGSAEAQHWVGAWLWSEGDVQAALAYWERAGEQGHAPSLLALGAVVEEGLLRGADADPLTALQCYEAAAAQGSEDGVAHAARLRQLARGSLSGSPVRSAHAWSSPSQQHAVMAVMAV